jgi:hypothetical protein
MSAPTVTDRTGCTAGHHGTEGAYRHGCRCADAREVVRLTNKRRREGRSKPGVVDATGTSRRIQALAALGWSNSALAEHAGCGRSFVKDLRRGRRGETVLRATADRWARIYNELSATPGPDRRARGWAAKQGFAPPLLWEGVDIDDPTAKPIEDKPAVQARPQVDLGEVEHLRGGRLSMDEIAKQLRVNVESIERAQHRARQRGTPEAIASYWSAIADGQTPAQAEAAASASAPVGWRRLQRPENDDEELAVPARDWAEDRSVTQGRVAS